jgi:hypothetical protein
VGGVAGKREERDIAATEHPFGAFTDAYKLQTGKSVSHRPSLATFPESERVKASVRFFSLQFGPVEHDGHGVRKRAQKRGRCDKCEPALK